MVRILMEFWRDEELIDPMDHKLIDRLCPSLLGPFSWLFFREKLMRVWSGDFGRFYG